MKKSPSKLNKPQRRPFQIPLVLKERDELISMLNSPVFQKVLANINALKPSSFPEGRSDAATRDVALSLHVVNNRMHTIQGWELFEAALALQTQEPQLKRQTTQDDFPDSGRLDNEE